MRPLRKTDIPHLKRLLMELCRQERFTQEEVDCALELLYQVLDNPEQTDYLVAVIDDAPGPVGYILYGPVPLTDGTWDIYWIATAPAVHGAGYGRLLLEHAERDMRRRGGRLICLETSSQDTYQRTRLFYDRSGYFQEACLKDFYRPGDDRITYVKRLAAPREA
ncbi:MAG TPA: GNAT family N-acetyltransferase [Desulfuromonadales bacterium]|nr:GNAT family N-acetyltransferase [Desulfuromonadales bacterium]